MTTEQDLKNLFDQATAPATPAEFKAVLGRADGTVYAGVNQSYVTLMNGQVSVIYNARVPLIPWRKVIVGYDEKNPTLLQVLRFEKVYDTDPTPDVANHADSHEWYSYDPVRVSSEQILPGLALPIPGTLTIQFYGTVFYLAGVHHVGNRVIDLTSYVPASGAQWGLVEIDATGTIDVVTSAVFASRGVLEYEDIPEPVSGNKGLFAVKLYANQTEFIKTRIDTDVIDLRFSGVASGGLASVVDWSDITGIPLGLGGIGTISVDGALTVTTFAAHDILITANMTINAWYIRCRTPGTAGTTTVDIDLNGTTIFTTQGNRPQLAWDDADGWVVSGLPDFVDFVVGDILSFHIDAVATGAADLIIVPLATAAGTPAGAILNDYILVQDQKATGTNGGTFTSGAWRTRDINTEAADSGGHCSISSNQITLAAGTYRCRISAPAFYVFAHQAILYNVTDAANELVGSSEYTGQEGGIGYTTRSFIEGEFVITDTKVFEVRHRCGTTQATNGFGVANSFGLIEIYTSAEFWKVA